MLQDKKAQMEIIGLIVIVLLLALGMLFFVKTAGEDAKKVEKISPQSANLAKDMVDAMKNVKVKCLRNGVDRVIGLDALVQDMADKDMVEYRMISCNNTPSSDYVEEITTNILNGTIVGKLNKRFSFKIVEYDNVLISVRSYSNLSLDPTLQEISVYSSSTENLAKTEPDCMDNIDYKNEGITPDTGTEASQILPLPSGGNVEMILYICD